MSNTPTKREGGSTVKFVDLRLKEISLEDSNTKKSSEDTGGPVKCSFSPAINLTKAAFDEYYRSENLFFFLTLSLDILAM